MQSFSKATIEQRRQKLNAAWDPVLNNEDAVMVLSGRPITKPGGLDQNYYFIPHPSYFWISGLRRPLGVSVYSKNTGWVDFIQPVSREEKLWDSGEQASPEGFDIAGLQDYFGKQRFGRVFLLGQPADADRAFAINADFEMQAQLKQRMDAVRRVKDADEVALVQSLALIANKGYEKIKSFLRPGVSEKEIQIEFEAEIQRHGSHRTPYNSIVGSGRNAAILHAMPTAKKVQPGELVLIDAGADIDDYCVDITRVFAVDGKFSSQQQDLYDLVKKSQVEAIAKSRVGVQWRDVHRATAQVIAEGLKTLKVMTGNTESILDSGAISVFYPHGVGHLVGLRVRDVGYEENLKPQKYCGVTLRVDLELRENFMITAEPGCYFVGGSIEDPELREKYKEFINWSEVEKWKDIGGVRIEDDILITRGAALNLTAVVPK